MTCGVGHRGSLDPALLWLWGSPVLKLRLNPWPAAHAPTPQKNQTGILSHAVCKNKLKMD